MSSLFSIHPSKNKSLEWLSFLNLHKSFFFLLKLKVQEAIEKRTKTKKFLLFNINIKLLCHKVVLRL
jgi:hypothetical protein